MVSRLSIQLISNLPRKDDEEFDHNELETL